MSEFSSSRRSSRRIPSGISDWLIAILLILVAVLFFRQMREEPAPLNDPNSTPRAITARGELSGQERATIQLARQAFQSVVHVTAIDAATGKKQDSANGGSGSGSGFIWDSQGYIVTNYHVVAAASEFKITLHDKSEYRAVLVGSEPDKDIAVLKITDAAATRFQAALIGRSNDLQVGQNVFAIGNPYGLENSLSNGIIAGLRREISSLTGARIVNVIQTSAAVNPGNSGGPLLDSAGRVIGMNTAVPAGPSGEFSGYTGIGFAIPIDMVNSIVPTLVRYGAVETGWLGIRWLDDDHEIFNTLRLPSNRKGVLFDLVVPGSAAAEAGLRPTKYGAGLELQLGDMLVGINDQKISETADVIRALEGRKPGDRITLTVIRDGQPIEVEVVLSKFSAIRIPQSPDVGDEQQ